MWIRRGGPACARRFATRELTGGTFETHFTFAQQLSEAAEAAPTALLAVSIPASVGLMARGRKGRRTETEAHDIEVGDVRGQEALVRLKNAIGRVESPWRAASAEETYEIVRRRLFQPVADPALYAARDAVIKRIVELYRAHPAEYPSECRERDYERKLLASYPLHPELFDRLVGGVVEPAALSTHARRAALDGHGGVTQRYAHQSPDHLRRAVAETARPAETVQVTPPQSRAGFRRLRDGEIPCDFR